MNAIWEKLDIPAVLDHVTGLDGWDRTSGEDAPEDGIQQATYCREDEHQATVSLDDRWLTIVVNDSMLYSGDYIDDEQLSPYLKSTE